MKLICGILSHQEDIGKAEERLCKEFGEIDCRFSPVPFTHTDYYNDEMGEGVLRSWVSFRGFVDQESLSDVKLLTNRIEEEFARPNGTRTVNLDPGLIDESKLILASTKNYAHRIYIGKGIYAEITLTFRQGSFQTIPWTYPDYAEHVEFFNRVRLSLRKERKNETDV